MYFSHYFDLDRAWPNAAGFTRDEKIALRDKVTAVLGSRMIRSNDLFIRFDDCTLEQLVSGGRTVICLFEDFGDLVSPADGIFSGDGYTYPSAKAAPSLAVGRDGRLNCAYVAKDDSANELWFIGSRDRGTEWTVPYSMHGQRSQFGASVAMGPDHTLYALFVADEKTNALRLTKSIDDGLTWSRDFLLPGQSTPMTPSLAVGRDGALYAVYAANDSSRKLYLTTSKDGGTNWEIRTLNGQNTPMTPALAIDAKGTLYALYVANDLTKRLLFTASTDRGETWTEQRLLNGQNTDMAPALALDAKGCLYVLYTANNKTRQLLITASTGGGANWTKEHTLSGQNSSMPPALTIDGTGMLYALYVGNNDSKNLYLTTSTNGQDWSGATPVVSYPHLATAGSYADSDDIQHVIDDQKAKFKDFAPRPGMMFWMSWTGTWHVPSVNPPHISPCLDVMADDLRPRLLESMQQWVAETLITRQKRPNVISVDYYDARIYGYDYIPQHGVAMTQNPALFVDAPAVPFPLAG